MAPLDDIPVSLATRLDRFLDELDRHGIDVSPANRAAAAAILARHLADGSDTARLAHRLAVLLAADQHEQQICQRAAAEFLSGATGNVVYSPVERQIVETGKAEKSERRTATRRWRLAGAAIVLAVAATLAWLLWPPPKLPDPFQTAVQKFQTVGEATPLPPETFTVTTQRPHPLRPWVIWGTAALPLFAFLAVLGLWLNRRRMWQQRTAGGLAATFDRLAGDPQFLVDLIADRSLTEAGTTLARGAPQTTRTLDVVATVRASASRAGAPTPVFAMRRSGASTYVLLVERKSRHDHMTRFADLVIDRFAELGARIERYYFNEDPRALMTADMPPKFVRLSALAHRLQDEKLVVVAAAEGFFHPLRGTPHDWIAEVGRMRTPALLSAAPFAPVGDPRRWSRHEVSLLARGFTLATATRRGIGLYGEHIATGRLDPAQLEGRRPTTTRRQSEARRTAPSRPRLPSSGQIFHDADQAWAPAMVTIPACPGGFLMGSPEGQEGAYGYEVQHRVTISRPFALARYPVTFDQYDAYCQETGAEQPGDEGWGRRRRPVITVSWHDAVTWCEWMSERTGQTYRLPTEAEWEYACRGDPTRQNQTQFCPEVAREGRGEFITTDEANFDGDYTFNGSPKGEDRGRTVPVDQPGFRPNGFGLWRMHGNVWEWCADVFERDYSQKPTDDSAHLPLPVPEDTRRVARGGSWDGDPQNLRSAIRNRGEPEYRDRSVGFRPARTLFTP